MATTDLERLVVKLEADLKSYEKSLAKAQGITVANMRKIERQVQQSATRVESQFSRMGKSIVSTFGRGLIAAATIEGVRRIGGAIRDLVGDIARMGDIADRIGLGTDELQAMALAATKADVDMEELNSSFLKFSKSIGAAQKGQGEFLKLLDANGKKLQGDFFANLKQFADLVANAGDQTTKTALTLEHMGKASEGMIEFLNEGGAGIDRMVERWKELGGGIDREGIKRIQELDDAWAETFGRMTQAVQRFTGDALIGLSQRIKAISEIEPGDKSVFGMLMDYLMAPAGTPFGAVNGPRPSFETRGRGAQFLPTPPPKPPETKLPDPDAEAEALRRQKEAADAAADAEQRRIDTLRDGMSTFQSALTSTYDSTRALELEAATIGMTTEQRETYLAQQELLNAALAGGVAITPELTAQIEAAARAYGLAAGQVEKLREQEQLMTDLQGTFQSGLQSLITDIAHGVEPVDALTDALGRLADQLLDIALNAAITGLFKQLAGAVGGGGGIPVGPGGIIAGGIHSGGVVGQHFTPRTVGPGAFAGAPRLHNGLRGDEFAAILQKGEIVLPKGFKMGHGGDGYGRVVVNNYGGQVEQKQTRGPGGERELQLWFRASFQRELTSPQTGKSLTAGYGLMPLTKRR